MEAKASILQTASELPATDSSKAPDWTAITHDVLCPLCDYNLRGLCEPRCPECGYPFDWAEVLDPVRRPHPRLFEHHPERNLKSFFQTARDGLKPATFWRSLHPGQPGNRRRIILYWLLCVVAFLLMTAFAMVPVSILEQQRLMAWGRIPSPSLAIRVVEALLESLVMSVLIGFLPALWPWATLLALMIFQWSMRRAQIRRIHVLRCCLYSFDGLWWLGLAPMLGCLLAILSWWRFDKESVAVLFWVPIVFGVHKLRQAYRYYLRFDHPGLTVLASQIIVVLALLCVWYAFDPDGPARLLAPLFSP